MFIKNGAGINIGGGPHIIPGIIEGGGTNIGGGGMKMGAGGILAV